MFVQTPLQLVRAAWQVSRQDPVEQICPAAHGVPHAPQFWLSLSRLTQVPAHSVRPPPHDVWHVPAEHT